MIVFSFDVITPQEAARLLQEHDDAVQSGEIINRPRKQSAVRRYAADMQGGQWNPDTAETLKFETQDKSLHGKHLVDGQNRLQAVVVADQSGSFYVARGVAREAFGYIDGGEKRNLRDVLKISGEPDADALTPALKWLCQWDFDNGRLTSAVVTTQRARRLLESDPALRKSVTKAKAVKDSGLMGVGLAAFLHRVFSKSDPALAVEFIEAVATGAALQPGDPFLILRQRLIENKGSRKKHPQKDIIALSIKAWNYRRQGRSIKLLRYSRGEEMPAIDMVGRDDDDSGGSTPTPAPENRPNV